MPQLWQGRSSKAVDSRVNDFNSSIRFDARMIEQDIHGSMVHSAMLGKQGIISQTICDQAEKSSSYVMPGYTHLQRAQPVTFGHQLMAYAWMLLRDLGRMQDATARMDAECPLGSGALAGTTYPLDRFYTAQELGFAAPCGNSIDGVSDRDFCIELTSAMATCMMHLSRLSEEIILWCSWEFKFIELDDAFTTGSSIMPQKKNPDVTELIRGKTGRVYGDLNTLLVMMKGIPLAYDKDMQEDKEAVFDAVDTLELCLKTITPMLATMTPLPANMRRAAAKGFINATDCADYLTKKGMPFRDAYKCTGTMVGACIRADKTLEELDLSFLCLPDAAAREVVPLLRPDVRILDTSTAHRTAPDWVYGLPELHGKRDALRTANRVAVPGCYATGFITLVAPLVELGLLAADYPLTCHGLSGYSGAGKSGIAQYRDPERDIAFESPRPYGLTLDHKHLPEMQKICGLAEPPVFCPIVDDYYCGMEVTVPLRLDLVGHSAEELATALQEYYAGETMIKVHALGTAPKFLPANTLAGKDTLEIYPTVSPDGKRMLLISLLDNLGKGSSGAAVQCMNIMLGLEETKGLEL